MLSRIRALVSGPDVDGLVQLLEAQTTAAVGSICDAINEAREEFGAARTDRQAVTEALAKLHEQQTKAVVEKFVKEQDFAEQFELLRKVSVVEIKTSTEIGKLDFGTSIA